jgi:hypothetical protein
MKKNYKNSSNLGYFLILNGLILLLIAGCSDKVKVSQTYSVMEPVYMTTAEIRSSFEVAAPKVVTNTGKIYLYGQYIFLNEPGEGIHIIDNSDKENPDRISFIRIPGNYEMAARGNRIFADSYLDLVVLDITNPTDVTMTARIEDIFLELAQQNAYYDPEKGVIVDYELKEIIEVHEGEFEGAFPSYFYYDTGIAFRGGFGAEADMLSSFAETSSSSPGLQTGIGGSMARFTIMKDHLYSIDNQNMTVFDITNLDNPVPGVRLRVGRGIETIFPYQDQLFIGSQTGMLIYDNSDPDLPVHLSTFEHIMSCDPVVVENDIAYVTLRSGTNCRNDFSNQLDVIDISDLREPRLLKTYPMTNPHGLGIENGILFICEGEAGLKVYDATDIDKISENMLAYYGDIHAFDVIPYNQNLILVGDDGLYQFDYSNPESIKFVSVISIEREKSM